MQTNSQKRESVEITLLSLLLARKRPCTLTQLTRDYYEMEGGHIPWRELGYHSLFNLLQSMPKSVFIDHRDNMIYVSGIASDKSKHVSKLVAGQKEQRHIVGRRLYKPSHYYPNTGYQRIHIPAEILTMIISYVNENPDGVNKDYVLKKVQSHMPYTQISMSDMEEQLQKLAHQIYLSHNKIFPAQSKLNNVYSSTAVVTASGNEDSDDVIDDDGDDDDFQFIPSGYKPDPSQTKANAKNMSTSNFIKETVSKCQDQVLQAEGTEHMSRMESDQTNSCNSHKYSHDDAEQSKTELNNNLDNENYFDGKNVDILINERVKFRLEKLIQNHPEGIWCADLPEKYLEEYKVSLNYTELGFNSVREFASQLPETFHCVQPYDTGDFMLYYAKKDIPSGKLKEKQKLTLAEMHNIYMKEDDDDALPLTLTLDTCKKLIPDGIVTIGECVGQLSVEDLLNIERPYIEVVVVEVFSPSFFWIQLRKKQKAFTQFMDDLNHFYARKHEDYVIPPVVLEKGLNCACIYNDVWHRGIIITVNPDLQVTVMFYDYGTLKTYPPDAVFYLHRMFSSIPAQAIPCGLINTRPYKGTKWSRSVTHHFAVRTSQLPLIATIASINSEDNSMMVTLTDTLGEEDVHINDWLVEQKLAEHGKMGDKVDMSNLLLYVEESLPYLPEQYYEEEIDDDKGSNKNSEEEAVNAPLVSPQSTLNDNKSFTFPSEIPVCDVLRKLPVIREETLQDQILKDIAMSVASPSSQTNTNPFLYDETNCNQVANELTPEKFIQLWTENVKLQMQITATFHLLLNRAMKYPDSSTGDNLIKNEQILNMMRNTLLHPNKDMPVSANLTTNNSSTYPATIPPISNSCNNAKTAAMNYDFMNTGYPTGSFTFTDANQQKLLYNASNYKNNLNCSNSADFFQNSGIQNSARNLTPMYPNSVVPADNNIGAANQFLVDAPAPAKENFTPRFEGFNTQLNIGLDGRHSFPNNVSTDFPTPSNKSINDTKLVKDTNPFRLMLAGKLRLSDSDEENSLKPNNQVPASHRNAEPVTEHNLISFENNNTNTNHPNQDIFDNLCKEKTFDYYQYFLTNSSGNVSNNNLSVVNTQTQPTNRKWSLDDVTSNMSRIIINNPSTVHNINLATEVGKHAEKDNGHVLNSNTYNYDTFAHTPYPEISPREYGEKQKQQESLGLKSCILPPRKPFVAHYSDSVRKANEQRSYYTNDSSTLNQSPFAHRNILTTTDRIPNCPTVKENSISSWSPLNSFIPPVSIDHTNADEGYLTRPSTSHTSYRSSPLAQVNNEAEHGQQSPAINSNILWGTPNRMSMKSIDRPTIIQPENWTKMNCLLKKNDNVNVGYNGSQQQNSSENICIRNAPEPQVNDLYSQESKLQNIWQSPAPEEPTFVDNKSTIQSDSSQTKKVFIQVIELPKRMIHVFHHKGEGWLLMDEFVQAFTMFDTVPYMMEFLDKINIHMPMTEIDRTQYFVEVFKLNGIMLDATHSIVYGTNNLQLMPLRSTLKLLKKMKIISAKDIDDAVKREFTNQVMREIWFIINAYGQLKHRIENEG